jgi:restriction endonuclease S subunit
MLEGLEIVELNSQDFRLDNFDFRLDAEYFLKSNLKLLEQLNRTGYKKIDDFSYVTDGIHTSIDYSETSNINLISATSPRENYFDVSRKAFISEIAHFNNPRTALKENDIILSTVGTIGNCAVATKSILPANSDRHVGIIRCNKEFLPNYVSTFLLSKYGRFQTWRESTGNVQLNLFIYKIRTLKIATLSILFQTEIANLVIEAHLKRQLSQQTYCTAEALLLETLGLKGFEPSTDCVNVKSYKESFLTSGRLDSEFYQKKYEDIESKILGYKNGADILKNQIEYITTGEYAASYESVGLESVPYIRNNNMKKGHIELDDEYYVNPNNFKTKANMGEILTSRVGTIGLFGVIKAGQENCVYSDNILCFKLKGDYIPEVYAMLFSTELYKLLLEKLAGGSVQSLITQTSIKELPIPNVEYSIQLKVADLINESFRLKKQSEQLLETAKRAVELAIEQDEEAAMRYFENARIKDAGGIACL